MAILFLRPMPWLFHSHGQCHSHSNAISLSRSMLWPFHTHHQNAVEIFRYRACEEAPSAGAPGGPSEGRGVQGFSSCESIEIVLQIVSRDLNSANFSLLASSRSQSIYYSIYVAYRSILNFKDLNIFVSKY